MRLGLLLKTVPFIGSIRPKPIASKDLGSFPKFPKIFSCSSLAWQANFASHRQCPQKITKKKKNKKQRQAGCIFIGHKCGKLTNKQIVKNSAGKKYLKICLRLELHSNRILAICIVYWSTLGPPKELVYLTLPFQ